MLLGKSIRSKGKNKTQNLADSEGRKNELREVQQCKEDHLKTSFGWTDSLTFSITRGVVQKVLYCFYRKIQ